MNNLDQTTKKLKTLASKRRIIKLEELKKISDELEQEASNNFDDDGDLKAYLHYPYGLN